MQQDSIFSRRLWIRIQNGKSIYSNLIYESSIDLDFELSFPMDVEKSNARKNAAQLNFASNRIRTMKNPLLLLHYLYKLWNQKISNWSQYLNFCTFDNARGNKSESIGLIPDGLLLLRQASIVHLKSLWTADSCLFVISSMICKAVVCWPPLEASHVLHSAWISDASVNASKKDFPMGFNSNASICSDVNWYFFKKVCTKSSRRSRVFPRSCSDVVWVTKSRVP